MPQTPTPESVAMIQKQIAGYCLLPTDPEVLETALAGMRRAIDRLNTREWNWAITYDDITFVVDQMDYPLTSWFKAPRNFELWNADSLAIGRFAYKGWKTFLTEHQDVTSESEPCVYSISNITEFGTLSLNSAPSVDWVTKYPSGRIWYYRRVQYPTVDSTLDIPSEVTAFIQAFAEGYTADRHKGERARDAYNRAREQLHELIVDDCHGQQTDWE